jgi:hypothetical protein
MDHLPEHYACRRFRPQLFATLTLVGDRVPDRVIQQLPVSWARRVARMSGMPFERLLWLSRFETGAVTGHGHFHSALAGLDGSSLTEHAATRYERAWYRVSRGGGSLVQIYDHARDGIGYILKCSDVAAASEYPPIVSNSLKHALRRGRM